MNLGGIFGVRRGASKDRRLEFADPFCGFCVRADFPKGAQKVLPFGPPYTLSMKRVGPVHSFGRGVGASQRKRLGLGEERELRRWGEGGGGRRDGRNS